MWYAMIDYLCRQEAEDAVWIEAQVFFARYFPFTGVAAFTSVRAPTIIFALTCRTAGAAAIRLDYFSAGT
jgi:hypothetical protein